METQILMRRSVPSAPENKNIFTKPTNLSFTMPNSSDQEDKKIKESQHQRLAQLAQDRRQILMMPPEKALDTILDHPRATALVHSMAEEDLFLLTHEIGAQDALELLGLASNRQWEYLLDLEIWNRDRISIHTLGYWMNLLSQADPERFYRWWADEKSELLEYYLHEAIDILVMDDQDDPSDLPDGFFTLDGVFYLCIRQQFLDSLDDQDSSEERQSLIRRLLQRLADEDLLKYQATLLRSSNVMPSESEEESFRFRNIRLAEKGFLPFEEAVGVYAPMKPDSVRKRPARSPAEEKDSDFTLPVPVHHGLFMDNPGVFATALWKIEPGELLDNLQIEFAALCNQIIAADQEPVRSRENLQQVVRKACGYLSIGLHRLEGAGKDPDPVKSVQILRNHPLADIFRTGYGMAAELRQKAIKWKSSSWFASRKLPLAFWGERLVGFIGGLMLARPKFFDNYSTGRLYRDFETIDDIKKSKNALEEAMAFDHVLSFMEIDTSNLADNHFITHESLLLTLWAKQRLGMPVDLLPLDIEIFRPFYSQLWEENSRPPEIKSSVKSDFLSWLSSFGAGDGPTLSSQLGQALENLFDRLAEDYGSVSPADLDPRFIHLFILKKTRTKS
jgi:hypothetical protein